MSHKAIKDIGERQLKNRLRAILENDEVEQQIVQYGDENPPNVLHDER